MIMIPEFLAEDVHMLVAKYYKMVEAFLLNRLNESLHVERCIAANRTDWE